MKKIFSSFLCSFLFVSCSNATKENCSNESAQALIKQTVQEELAVHLTVAELEDMFDSEAIWRSADGYSRKYHTEQLKDEYRYKFRDYLVGGKPNLQSAFEEKLLLNLDRGNEAVKEIKGIRPTSVNEDLKICTCEAEVIFTNSIARTISYEVQQTEEDLFTKMEYLTEGELLPVVISIFPNLPQFR